jgi:hypothetical protein
MQSSEMIYFWFCLYWIKYFTGSAEACWGRYALSSDCLPMGNEVCQCDVTQMLPLLWLTKIVR